MSTTQTARLGRAARGIVAAGLRSAPCSSSLGPCGRGAKKTAARRGHAMGVGGGGGVYWLVDARRRVVAMSFQQSFEGAREEDDGLGPPGNDCVDMALKAVDEGRKKAR
mmetsp:Transcript_25650/g.82847  ORF Transcript_25650/g.82847 Transcript_25650/m.82847 type:complete len:109 (+) Transcript_25650:1202-1528(+)